MTIKTKIILATTAVFGVMLTLFAVVIYESTKEAELTKLDARLESHAEKIATELEEDNDEPVFPDRPRLAALHTEGLPETHFQLIDRKGDIVIGDSMLMKYSTLRWEEALQGTSPKAVFTIGEHSYRCTWARVEINDQFPFVIQLAAPMSELEGRLHDLQFLFLTTIPLALLLAALAVYFITRMAFRPIESMVETARHITGTDLHHRVDLPRAHDEVRLLGETFNNMIDRLDAAFRSQKQFIADASHEIRTPLTVICTELEYAEQHAGEQPVRESLQTSLAEIDHLAKLADGLLLLARLDGSQSNLRFQTVRLDELLLECIQRVRSVAERKRIAMSLHIQEAVEFAGDREKLQSIILNLLDNAVKYSSHDTTVTISLFFKDAARDAVMLTVADQGPGIPSSELTHIFKRFYRADPSRSATRGSGLGLAIVERLVELHGGTVSVQSEVGKGSTFLVELPLTGKSSFPSFAAVQTDMST